MYLIRLSLVNDFISLLNFLCSQKQNFKTNSMILVINNRKADHNLNYLDCVLQKWQKFQQASCGELGKLLYLFFVSSYCHSSIPFTFSSTSAAWLSSLQVSGIMSTKPLKPALNKFHPKRAC